jgi:hypothetical protein
MRKGTEMRKSGRGYRAERTGRGRAGRRRVRGGFHERSRRRK